MGGHYQLKNSLLTTLGIVGAALYCGALITPTGVAAQSGAASSAQSTNWSKYSFDYSNSNNNPFETVIFKKTAPFLQRAWQTFNDSKWRPGPPPTGFVLEKAVGLRFPATVVGVTSLPLVIDGTIYYIDQLGTMFARDAKTGTITDPKRHWTTSLVDPDYVATPTPYSPELYYTAPVATKTHIWIRSSVNGRVHAVRRIGGQEEDFDPNTPGIQPYKIPPDLPLDSNLGEPVIVYIDAKGRVADDDKDCAPRCRTVFISERNVILQDRSAAGDGVMANQHD